MVNEEVGKRKSCIEWCFQGYCRSAVMLPNAKYLFPEMRLDMANVLHGRIAKISTRKMLPISLCKNISITHKVMYIQKLRPEIYMYLKCFSPQWHRILVEIISSKSPESSVPVSRYFRSWESILYGTSQIIYQ